MTDVLDEGLKAEGNGTQEKQTTSTNDTAGDGLKNQGTKEKAEKLLDGTDPNKKITVNKQGYDERNDKAKLYESFAPIIDEVLKDPEIVKRFAEKKEETVEDRITRLEAEQKSSKRVEMKEAVTAALERFKGFESSWDEVRPIAESLMKQGYSAKEAMRRGYLAVHPEEAGAEQERIAHDAQNREGSFSSSGSYPTRPDKIKSASDLSKEDVVIADRLIRQGAPHVKSHEDFAKILDKHKGWIDRQLRNIGE